MIWGLKVSKIAGETTGYSNKQLRRLFFGKNRKQFRLPTDICQIKKIYHVKQTFIFSTLYSITQKRCQNAELNCKKLLNSRLKQESYITFSSSFLNSSRSISPNQSLSFCLAFSLISGVILEDICPNAKSRTPRSSE